MPKPELNSHLKRLGYDWYRASPEDVANQVKKALEQAEEIWGLDVYATNDGVYTTYKIRYPFPDREIEIHLKDIPGTDGSRIKRLSL